MRFNTPEEVREWAVRVAEDDYRRHIEYGIDLNPFSTDGARSEWQKGFDGAPLQPWEGDMEFATIYQRGKAAAEIVAREEGNRNDR